MKVPRLGIEAGFRILVRLVGTEEDFRARHVVTLTLTDPNLEVLGTLEHPIEPRQPGPDHISEPMSLRHLAGSPSARKP